MQRLLCAAKFRQDVARDGRLTVDDQKSAPPFSVHCMQLDELLFFAMVNSLFSLMLENEPSNHLHSIVIPKSYIANGIPPPEGRRLSA